MNKRIGAFSAMFFLLLALTFGAPALAAQISCEKWNTWPFFERAGAADVSRCLKAGADVNARARDGWTPLHRAARFSKTPEIVAALLKAGADVNASARSGWTPLHMAAQFSDAPGIVTALVDAGAGVNARSRDGWTPLHVAAGQSKTPRIVAALVGAGARLKARNKRGWTPLHVAAGQNKTPEIAEVLVWGGADVNARDEIGWTPLHTAAQSNRTLGVVEVLLRAGVNVNARNTDEVTPLHMAAGQKKSSGIVAALLEAGADVNAPARDGWTPLHWAAQFSETSEIVATLLEAGADADARAGVLAEAENGVTPLHAAAQFNETPGVVEALLAAGANPAATTPTGKTPWDYARENAALAGMDVYWRLNEERFVSARAGGGDVSGDARSRLAAAQRALTQLGYNPGAADGVFGPRTGAAIRAFEERSELPVTGRFSEELARALLSAVLVARLSPVSSRALERKFVGSGFRVSSAGHVLTNAHVVQDCAELRVPPLGRVRLLAREDSSGLALLRGPEGTFARFRQGRGIRPGARVLVVGYPVQNLFASEAIVRTGGVRALADPGDDRRLIQITAPVQPGSSGGPVLDAAGNLVGVVVSRSNVQGMAQATDSFPQNVNFAVAARAARAFLDAEGVDYETTSSTDERKSSDVAAMGRRFTLPIECWK